MKIILFILTQALLMTFFLPLGFLSHPPSGYPSYLTPPAPASTGAPPDPRSSSIAALRMKAKEHVESLNKGLQMV